jgi:hypothetical protein
VAIEPVALFITTNSNLALPTFSAPPHAFRTPRWSIPLCKRSFQQAQGVDDCPQ